MMGTNNPEATNEINILFEVEYSIGNTKKTEFAAMYCASSTMDGVSPAAVSTFTKFSRPQVV